MFASTLCLFILLINTDICYCVRSDKLTFDIYASIDALITMLRYLMVLARYYININGNDLLFNQRRLSLLSYYNDNDTAYVVGKILHQY